MAENPESIHVEREGNNDAISKVNATVRFTPVTLVLRRLGLEDCHEFHVKPGYILCSMSARATERDCLKQTKNQTNPLTHMSN